MHRCVLLPMDLRSSTQLQARDPLIAFARDYAFWNLLFVQGELAEQALRSPAHHASYRADTSAVI